MVSTDYSAKHACLIYKYLAEQTITTWEFFKEGFVNGEKCIYIANDDSIENLVSEIKNKGEELDEYLSSGKLQILYSGKTYLGKGFLDTSSMRQIFSDAEDQSLLDGYKGLRVSGELPLLEGKPIDSDSILKYESEIDNYLQGGRRISALCNYGEKIYAEEVLRGIINSHQVLKMFGGAYSNEFYRKNSDESYADIIERLIEDKN